MAVGVKHQDSQNSFLAFLNAPTSALDQFDVGPSSQPNTRVLLLHSATVFVQTNVFFVSFSLHSLLHQDSYSSSSSSLIEFWEDVSLEEECVSVRVAEKISVDLFTRSASTTKKKHKCCMKCQFWSSEIL